MTLHLFILQGDKKASQGPHAVNRGSHMEPDTRHGSERSLPPISALHWSIRRDSPSPQEMTEPKYHVHRFGQPEDPWTASDPLKPPHSSVVANCSGKVPIIVRF